MKGMEMVSDEVDLIAGLEWNRVQRPKDAGDE